MAITAPNPLLGNPYYLGFGGGGSTSGPYPTTLVSKAEFKGIDTKELVLEWLIEFGHNKVDVRQVAQKTHQMLYIDKKYIIVDGDLLQLNEAEVIKLLESD